MKQLVFLCRDKCSDCRGMRTILKRKDVSKYLAGYTVAEMDIDKTPEAVWRQWSGPGTFALPLMVWLKDGQAVYKSFGPTSPQTLIAKLKKL